MGSNCTQPLALVTGASRGIGRAIAARLAADGYDLLITYREKKIEAFDLARCLEADYGRRCEVLPLDVANSADIGVFVAEMSSRGVNLRLLVNNAGEITPSQSFTEASNDTWMRAMSTGLVGPSLLTRGLLPLLCATEGACIVNIGSVYGAAADAAIAPYSCAKASLHALTLSLAKELAPGVRVNAVLPGHIRTDMTLAAGQPFIDRVIAATPMGRLGNPEEIASTVAFLASSEAAFITGQLVEVDGGWTLR